MSDYAANLEEAYIVMAGFVARYGGKYLPIFERLHAEREKLKASNDLLALAKGIADKL